MTGAVSLGAYAGQTVAIRFRATTDASLMSSFYLAHVGMMAGGFAEMPDPHASIGPVTPEPKPATSKEEEEEKAPLPQRVFLPLVTR